MIVLTFVLFASRTRTFQSKQRPIPMGMPLLAALQYRRTRSRLLSTTQLANSPEPIFVPKIQITFADFPYLHYSNRPEAVHLGYRLRI